MLNILIVSLAAYLIGSINTSIIVCKIMALPDPRSMGSKNPGTTNVLRIGNKRAAITTLLGDVSKGILAVWLAKLLSLPIWAVGLTAIAVTLGHVFPLYFQFKGGKGVTTAIGSILCLNGFMALILMTIWLLTAWLSRYSSLAALAAIITAPLLGHYFYGTNLALPLLLLSLLLLWRHRSNIQRLLQGTETKISW